MLTTCAMSGSVLDGVQFAACRTQTNRQFLHFLLLFSCLVPSADPFFAFLIIPPNWPESLARFLLFSFCLISGT